MGRILPIRLYGDPVLKRRALPVRDFSGTPELAQDMLETMFEARGVGLAAPQVGISQRLIVAAEYLEDEGEEGSEAPLRTRVKEVYVMANPVITYREGRQSVLEGCLSLPGLYAEGAQRDLRVRVEYQNERGEKKALEAEGYLAVVLQHEIDHLDGIFFFQRMLPADKQKFLDEHRKELAEFQRQARAFLREEAVRLGADGHRWP
ncbi:MAG: peptide deformylase [Meiothermus sp.]|uniref:peptide deformylase n=1 Tax=Meiothermus sp. TaxID=1955249 RepID=UPI0025F9C272|nr:peptide deformylase [Meiothermus sp.]MCS7057839.1 peptide deformylase [Meiothermus sp.]MCS7194586.1 peptide deformylase [Meiothermus sp.]MCX7739420.1 peptide deformylase [Meiothermus sp.]MDW8090781.1 peptide deformylase [Meiothermus sp.]MDW8480796.1 peptide deformylase [Meiothermus sp.]